MDFDSPIWPLKRLRRLLHSMSRPSRREVLPGGLIIYPYRGYGSREEILLMGRVIKRPRRPSAKGENLRGDMANLTGQLFSYGVAGVSLRARLNGAEQLVISDGDGYFRFHMRLERPLRSSADALWHSLPIELLHNGRSAAGATGEFLVPPDAARFVVISDIDDTVIFTGVANKLKMLVRLFLRGARSRIAFPGTAALYNALHRGATGSEMNPMLYVSRGPWSIYEILDEFFNMHRIPVGPILFLREWGLNLRHPFPRRAKGHKAAMIRRMLDLYHDLPCVLIGDSGQHDAEIYTHMAREYPGRIAGVYIRNVSRSRQRLDAIEMLAREIAAQGSSLFLAADSFAMAEHMAQAGLISSKALAGVHKERLRQARDPHRVQSQRVVAPNPAHTEGDVFKGKLKEKLGNPAREKGRPPNIVFENDPES